VGVAVGRIDVGGTGVSVGGTDVCVDVGGETGVDKISALKLHASINKELAARTSIIGNLIRYFIYSLFCSVL
jgi:hypothetical protein